MLVVYTDLYRAQQLFDFPLLSIMFMQSVETMTELHDRAGLFSLDNGQEYEIEFNASAHDF